MDDSLQEKIDRLKGLLDKDPSDNLGWFLYGRVLMEANRLEEAAAAFERCVELNPGYSAAYRLWGDCYRKLDRKDQAREVYQRGIEVAEERGDLQTVKEMKTFLRRLGDES